MELITLAKAIEEAGKRDPSRGFTFLSEDGVPGFPGTENARETFFSFATIERRTASFGGALQSLGLKKGDRVALILPQNEDFVIAFLGAIRAGIIPAPIYPPLGLGQLHGYLENTRHIVAKSGARVLITSKQIKALLGTVQEGCPALQKLVAIDDVRDLQETLKPVEITLDDPCFIQFTSGSTSRPKGVVLTHRNLAANMKCIMFDGLRVNKQDVGVSWLPLFHDMGLIGFVLSPIMNDVPVVFLPPLTFLKRPATWLQAITRYKGTITYAPNFAFALCVKRIKGKDLDGIKLDTIRVAGCGAEPIRPENLENFAKVFGEQGFRSLALLPSYGMAESSLAVAFTELEEGMKTLSVDGERLWAEGEAFVVEATNEAAIPLVSCGPKFADHDMQIFAADDAASSSPLAERKVGEIRIQGPSVMAGYFEDTEKTKEAFAGDFLRTGDLGFLHEGRIYICGRSKEVIIVNGRNYYPQDIEWEASKIDGVRKGNVIAFGTRDAGSDKEKVIVAFEVTLNPGETLEIKGADLVAKVRTSVQQGLGLTIDDAVPVVAGALPKTSSGKLQRTKTRELYDQGELSDRKGKRDQDKLDLIKEAAKSQFSFLKLAVLGRGKDKK